MPSLHVMSIDALLASRAELRPGAIHERLVRGMQLVRWSVDAGSQKYIVDRHGVSGVRLSCVELACRSNGCMVVRACVCFV